MLNKNVCKKCRKGDWSKELENKWNFEYICCPQDLTKEYIQSCNYPMRGALEMNGLWIDINCQPPSWCGYKLEQTAVNDDTH